MVFIIHMEVKMMTITLKLSGWLNGSILKACEVIKLVEVKGIKYVIG